MLQMKKANFPTSPLKTIPIFPHFIPLPPSFKSLPTGDQSDKWQQHRNARVLNFKIQTVAGKYIMRQNRNCFYIPGLERYNFWSVSKMPMNLINPYNLRTLHPKFQKIWAKNKVARALPCLAWAPPNFAGRQHSATGFCFGPFAKLCLVQLISNFESKFLEYWGNYVPIAIWIGENSEHPN